MPGPFFHILPSPDRLALLSPAEVAGVIIPVIVDEYSRMGTRIHVRNYLIRSEPEHVLAISEAFSWLVSQTLLVQDSESDEGFLVPSRRARLIRNREDFEILRKSELLRKEVVHEVLWDKVIPDFLRGDYDAVVFKAFKAVEVAVRDAGGFSAKEIGTDLMRRAFNIDNGSLSDTNAERSEREAISNLFAGAIGAFKNPSSHRNVAIGAEDSVQLVGFASFLLSVVDARCPSGS